jgi:LytS/YehU family sensor histidine kinase
VAYGSHSLQSPGTVVREFYIIDMVFAFILYAAKVGLVTYAKLQEVATEADRLEQENAHEAFETLKNNINPTFLFGSLHTLSELIYQHKDRACELVNELSDVYRYVLDNKDKELVSLEKELAYLHLYVDLLNAQHPGKMHIHIAVDQAFLRHLLPPLLLQFMLDLIIMQFSDEDQPPFTIAIHTDATGHLIIECPGLSEKEMHSLDKLPLLEKLMHKYKDLTAPRLIQDPEKGSCQIKLRLLEAA